jgi:hypothetical protein
VGPGSFFLGAPNMRFILREARTEREGDEGEEDGDDLLLFLCVRARVCVSLR